MNQTADCSQAPNLWSIAEIERDTGLGKDTLRIWERRYGFPTPLRDARGDRVYDQPQLQRLIRIKQLLDSGHRPGRVVPLSLPGLMAGLLLCFVLAAGSYVTPQILGSTRDALFGNIIFDTIMGELNWPMGSTLSLVLLIFLGAVAAGYSRYMGLSRVFKGLGG